MQTHTLALNLPELSARLPQIEKNVKPYSQTHYHIVSHGPQQDIEARRDTAEASEMYA